MKGGKVVAPSVSDDVAAWAKRLSRKGPFYLFRTEPSTHTRYDHSTTPATVSEVPASIYVVIWNEGEKTKLGALQDYMYCRYGIGTRATLSGDTPYDLWNGHNVDDESFSAMLDVRHGRTKLPEFDLLSLVGLNH